ncbi:hypothetical protein SDRG_14510 [Saprolegnia diclina VS20]|uniref:FBD domain-containing protein n=1 Tax=Saprolegnia diclina (strain VS20) TaxID=1156394 RepID=T0PZT3_SAPDV|nr:hypothetical protein SDRG_14510 [Saprolegnia diclina VS20]EQC27761.1 hypothetical protein SDRG_14510 [Saprolegnia diclina VS20]|eukprot:XP_008618866.1 hypothetical protein SDRG_14510 [Saprolegnia diclina VS20]
MQTSPTRPVRLTVPSAQHLDPTLPPGVIAVIVEHIGDNDTLLSFLSLWPEKHLTLPLQALRHLLGHITSQLRVAWPLVHVLEDNLDEQTMDYLYGTFSLSPQIHIEYPLGDAADVDDVLQDYGPCLVALKLYSSFEDVDDAREMRSMLLSVPHLRRLEVHLVDRDDAIHGLSLLLHVLEHPTLTHFTLANGEDPVQLDIAFSNRLLQWLQTRRAVPRWPKLRSLALASHRCSLSQCLSLLRAIVGAVKCLTSLDLSNDVWSRGERDLFWRELATVASVDVAQSASEDTEEQQRTTVTGTVIADASNQAIGHRCALIT